MKLYDTLGGLKRIRNFQIEEGYCPGVIYVHGKDQHYESCKSREQCELYKNFKRDDTVFPVNWMRKLTPRNWRRCKPVEK